MDLPKYLEIDGHNCLSQLAENGHFPSLNYSIQSQNVSTSTSFRISAPQKNLFFQGKSKESQLNIRPIEVRNNEFIIYYIYVNSELKTCLALRNVADVEIQFVDKPATKKDALNIFTDQEVLDYVNTPTTQL